MPVERYKIFWTYGLCCYNNHWVFYAAWYLCCNIFYVLLDDAKPKSGKCPPLPKDVGVCIASCSIDKDCSFDQKCCSNGCGHTCKQPFYGMIDVHIVYGF